MNTKTKTTLILISVVALLLGGLAWQTDWDARAIRRQLNELAELVEKEGKVSTFEALGRSRQLADFFTEAARIEYLPQRSLPADKDALSAAFLSVWGQIDRASIRLSRHEIVVDAEASGAESTVLATVEVVFQGGDTVAEAMKYRLVWLKEDGAWRLKRVIPMGRL